MKDVESKRQYTGLIDAATEVLRKNFHPIRHTVGAAVLCDTGNIYTGINVESSGHGVCAEPIAIGAALSNGERRINAVVAVCDRGDDCAVLSPCGNCRQMMLDYAPDADVVYVDAGKVIIKKAKDLLPGAYVGPDF
jgi:cytidine deaminase